MNAYCFPLNRMYDDVVDSRAVALSHWRGRDSDSARFQPTYIGMFYNGEHCQFGHN